MYKGICHRSDRLREGVEGLRGNLRRGRCKVEGEVQGFQGQAYRGCEWIRQGYLRRHFADGPIVKAYWEA